MRMRAPAGPVEAGSDQSRRRSSHIDQACPGCSMSMISLQRYMNGNGLFIPQGGQRGSERESLSHLLVFWSSLVGAVLQAGLCDPDGRWLTRAGS